MHPILRTARPKQWLKNVLVFAAPGAAGVLDQPGELGVTALAFVSFCLAASGTYFWNDVLDVEADRSHPTKSQRPIATGEVSLMTGRVLGTLLPAVAIGLAALTGEWRAVAVVSIYMFKMCIRDSVGAPRHLARHLRSEPARDRDRARRSDPTARPGPRRRGRRRPRRARGHTCLLYTSLQLILKEQVDLYEIDLSHIVDGYLAELEKMQTLDLDVTTEFLLIAATLVELKTRRLLPGQNDMDLDEEFALWEERDLLLARLIECKTFKDVAQIFHRLADEADLSFPRTVGPDERFAELMPDRCV